MSLEEIPPDLIINWDQTGINYVPVGSWTMEKEGARRVELVGKDDKHRCIPKVELPDDWHVTFSVNHRSNEGTMIDYIEKILLQYMERKRKELQLTRCYPALVIFDNFKA